MCVDSSHNWRDKHCRKDKEGLCYLCNGAAQFCGAIPWEGQLAE